MNAEFQDFQRAFGRHLRDPAHTPRPAGVPGRRMAVYNELLFNNIGSFLDPCFPVCQAILGAPRWQRLKRAFYRDWPLATPWFRDIPREFVRYLNSEQRRHPLPRWLGELAHYEWAELAVDLMDTAEIPHDADGDLLSQTLVINSALMNLSYQWPVQRIGPDYRPRRPELTCLVVYRDRDEHVQFAAVNPLTSQLLARLITSPVSGEQLLRALAHELEHPDPALLLRQGLALLEDLRRQDILLGTQA